MEQQQLSQLILSPSNSGRTSISFSNSPEFEFNCNNSNFSPSKFLTADELFADGILLPFHLRPDPAQSFTLETTNPNPNPQRDSGPELTASSSSLNPDPQRDLGPELTASSSSLNPEPQRDPGPELTASSSSLTASKRWMGIFKKTDPKPDPTKHKNHEEKDKRKEKRGNGNGTNSAELNINIWPFSRSRSAGNGGARPRLVTGSPVVGRKVSSAPCSRSNSAGESKSRKWPSSPARGGGVHLGRSSPIWKGPARRGTGKAPMAGGGDGGGKANKVLNMNMNVPMCIGYRNRLSCKSDVNGAVVVMSRDSDVAGKNGGVGSVDGGRGGNMFNLRSLFSKKVY